MEELLGATRQAAQTQEAARATESTTGPPEGKYSQSWRNTAESEAFAADIQEWYEEGMPQGERFILGSTGEVLQGLGAIESDIYINGDKIKTILHDHPEMSINEIQRIPEILDDPVLVLKSRGTGTRGGNSRMVLFGSVKAQNGQPVMTVLDLRPSENGFLLDDMQKVNSAYTKKNPANFVTNSEVMYADAKRTTPLLRQFGLTIASRQLLRSGSMGSITYQGNTVNLQGEKFSSVVEFSDSDERFSMRLSDEETDSTLKGRQWTVIQESNPAEDGIHTWIRSKEEIKTFQEALNDPDWSDGSDFDPDYTWQMAQEAAERGEIRVYSSDPIAPGAFVTPSRMEAESYSGSGSVHEKTVNLTDVAWIDPTQMPPLAGA